VPAGIPVAIKVLAHYQLKHISGSSNLEPSKGSSQPSEPLCSHFFALVEDFLAAKEVISFFVLQNLKGAVESRFLSQTVCSL
jgi:hypothetical protein